MVNSNQNHAYQQALYLHLAVLIFGVLSFLLSSCPASAQEQPLVDGQTQSSSPSPAPTPTAAIDGGFHFSLSPYLWFAGAHGTVGALGRDVSMHASAGDLLSHLDFGLMGAAEASYNRLVLNGDLLWIRLSDDRALPFPGLGAVSADARVGQFVWTSKFGYRVINQEHFKADATIGVRYWHLGEKLNFNPPVLGIDFNGSQNWADILVGGRVQLPVGTGEKAVVNLVGDVGGWNASAKLDYQFAAVLGYKLCPKWTLQAGYRYLFVDYRPSNLSVYNAVTSGALLGVTYTLK